jgi:hypothetical protein
MLPVGRPVDRIVDEVAATRHDAQNQERHDRLEYRGEL